jgi:hypothetical protein
MLRTASTLSASARPRSSLGQSFSSTPVRSASADQYTKLELPVKHLRGASRPLSASRRARRTRVATTDAGAAAARRPPTRSAAPSRNTRGRGGASRGVVAAAPAALGPPRRAARTAHPHASTVTFSPPPRAWARPRRGRASGAWSGVCRGSQHLPDGFDRRRAHRVFMAAYGRRRVFTKMLWIGRARWAQ